MEKSFQHLLVYIFLVLLVSITLNVYQIHKDLDSQIKAKPVLYTSLSIEDRHNNVVEVVGKYTDGDIVGFSWTYFIVRDAGKLKVVGVKAGSELDTLKPVPKYMKKSYASLDDEPTYSPILAELIPPGK